MVTTLAGSGAGFADGPATTARFYSPSSVAIMQNGNVVIADNANHRIRLIAPDGTVTTLAGSGTVGFADGNATTAQFYNPWGIAVMQNGNVVVGDLFDNRIRLVAPDGTVTALAGGGPLGNFGFADGPATTARFYSPGGVAVMQNGNVVVADRENNRIRLVAPDGTVTTLAGSGTAGCVDGPATTAQFSDPFGVAVMPNGSVVVADSYNNRIRLVAPDGTVTTLAGSGTAGLADGSAATARFDYPIGVTVMPNGNVVVADSNNHRIRLVAPNGTVTTVAGNGTKGYTEGPAMTASFCEPSGVVVMQNGSIIVADLGNHRIRLVDEIGSTWCTVAANCNNHATNVSGTLSSGCTCNCSIGYTGTGCGSCATYYTGYPTCTPIACTNSADCSGHASTVSKTLVSGCTCNCSTAYTGAACSSCATYYTGYPTCILTLCGANVTLASQPPAMKLLSVSLSQDNADVSMVLRGKAKNTVVVVYQRDVGQTATSRLLGGISRSDFNLYATCAAAPSGIRVAPDGTGTVAYSHSVDYTLCEQGATDGYVVITCAFAVEHYVWPAAEFVPLMTASEAPVTIRVPRSLEQTIVAERFTVQIFPGLLVATTRGSANKIRSFTLVQSSSWITSSTMCTLSTDALSITCVLHPMATAGQHNAEFQVVFVNDEASSAGVSVSVSTRYVGKYVPNIFGRCVALHFTTTDLRFSPTEALVFLYQPHNTTVYGNSTYLSALLLVNAAGESISVMGNSGAFNFTCSNVSTTNLTQCSFLPAAVATINRRFAASNLNLTLRATFSFEEPPRRRDTEDVLVTTGLTIDHSATASHATIIVVIAVVCGVVLLLILGAVAFVVLQRRAVPQPGICSPPVSWPSDMSDECAVAVVNKLFDVGGSFQTLARQVVGYRLCSVDIVRNTDLATGLAVHLGRLKNLRQGDAALFHFECQCDEQREVLSRLTSLFHPVLHYARREPHTLTVYHGCSASVARKIVKGGFVDLAALDAGYFGSGIYVTPNAEYACQYALAAHSSEDEQHSPEHPDWFPILLCTAAVGLVYPVTRQVDYTQQGAHSNLHGLPLKKPFDAHFALVSHHNGYEAAPPAIAQYGELCVSQYAAILPLAILWVSTCN